jgi:hypothetical protein
VIAGTGVEHRGEALRAAQAVAALDEPDDGERAQLEGAVHDAVLAGHHQRQVAAVGGALEAGADLRRQPLAGGLVAVVVGQIVGGAGGLAEVVEQAGEAPGQRQAGGGGLVEHQQQVRAGVDLGVVGRRLGHAEQAIHLGQQAGQGAAVAQHLDHPRRAGFHQAAGELLPHPLGHQRVHLAGGDHLAHQRQGFGGHRKVGKAGGEAGQPQDAHRVFGEGRADVAEHPRGEVALPAVGVGQGAVGVAGDGVDGEVAAGQVFFEGHRRVGVEDEAGVARRGLALGAGQRVLLVGARVEEDREVLADRLVALGEEHLGVAPTTTQSRSLTGRPRSSSRMAPPTQ